MVLKSTKLIQITIRSALILFAGFCLSACELTEEKDEASTAEVSLRPVDIDCNIADVTGCSALNNGSSLRIAIVDDCDAFTDEDDAYSIAEATLDCSTLYCEVEDTVKASDFSSSTVPSGTYDIYAYIDIDNDKRPDTTIEPIGCETDVSIMGSTSTVTISTWY